MKKILPLLMLITALAVHGQNPGFPYNNDEPLFNSPMDTIPAVKKLNRALNILKEFRIQAYIQAEWQHTDTAGSGVGSVPKLTGVQGGQFPLTANNRFLLRRGRFKLSFEHKNAKDLRIVEFAFQYDASEKGFTALKDFYGRIIDPWTGWFGIQGGIFLRPFGNESPAPPAFYESPEFSRMNQTIMPNECELGEAIVIESPAKFQTLYFRTDLAMVNGEGIGVGSQTGTYQSRKDFIGRIKLGRAWDLNGGSENKGGATLGLNGTLSFYYGGVEQTTNNVYEMVGDTMKNITVGTADTAQKFKAYYTREYYGAHLEFKADYYIGTTTLRGEFIAGQQPGSSSSSQVPLGAGNAVPGSDLYIRNFSGAMFYLTQSFKNHMRDGHTMYHDITVKYDWYDPNTKVSGTQVNSGAGLSATDMKYTTLGVGYSFIPYNWFKLMIWYDYVINESTGLTGLTSDYKKDNVLTIRTQFYVDTKWFGSKSKTKDNLMLKQY
jgi:hypothetical protein